MPTATASATAHGARLACRRGRVAPDDRSEAHGEHGRCAASTDDCAAAATSPTPRTDLHRAEQEQQEHQADDAGAHPAPRGPQSSTKMSVYVRTACPAARTAKPGRADRGVAKSDGRDHATRRPRPGRAGDQCRHRRQCRMTSVHAARRDIVIRGRDSPGRGAPATPRRHGRAARRSEPSLTITTSATARRCSSVACAAIRARASASDMPRSATSRSTRTLSAACDHDDDVERAVRGRSRPAAGCR